MRARAFLIIFFFLFPVTVVRAQDIAITMDNPHIKFTPLLSAKARDKMIRNSLDKNHLKIVLFVQGSDVNSPEGKQLLKNWNREGHILGNHTYSHDSLTMIEENEFENDTLKNEEFLMPFSQFRRIFRFPFLKEGDTASKRDDFRNFLRKNNYVQGSVTIDASDWYISDRLEKRLKENPKANITPYKEYYLEHIWNRAQYYDNLAQRVLGKSPSHTLLIHHNLLNALFLDDLIQMFKDKGWTLISASYAFCDPIFKIEPDILPAGESLIWAMAKQTGHFEDELRYPGEDGVYEKDAMDRLGL